MRIISLGWGIQSIALAVLSAVGELPKADFAVFADTGFEVEQTYAVARDLTPRLESHGIRVVTIRSNFSPDFDRWGGVYIPAYTNTPGRRGQLRRQCTREWKLLPIRRWIRKQLKRRGEKRVELWLGITQDEEYRASPSRVRYIRKRYPFLESDLWGGRYLRRRDIVGILREYGINPNLIPKSSCFFCPYRSTAEWRWMWEYAPQNWKRAVEFDEHIRKAKPPYDLFLTPRCVPLKRLEREFKLGRQLWLWR